MTEEEYRKEWESGLHRTDYNDCRFAADRTAYAREWIAARLPGVDIDDPKTLVDRINRYKIYDLDPLKEKCADKISVIDEVEARGCGETVVRPYYAFRCTEFTREMYDSIPDGRWVFKCNHGSGWNMAFEKGPGRDPSYMFGRLNGWLALDYAFVGGWEWQYHGIERGVMVQPRLADGPLMDWSFWCEDGEIEYIQLTRKLSKCIAEYFAFTDAEGGKPDIYIGAEPMRFRLLPWEVETVEMMKPYVRSLARGFRFVRVDMYCVGGKAYFGELTFTPCSGKLVMYRN